MFSRRTSAVVTVLLVLLVTVALVVSAVPGFAAQAVALPQHAQLVSTSPEDGTTVDTVDEVSATFSEDPNAQFVQMRVEGPDGDETEGEPTVDGRTVSLAVADLPVGEHTVTYRVVSVDGHPVSGTFSFTTTAAAEPTAEPSPSPSSASASPSASSSAAPSPTPTPSPSTAPVAADASGPGRALPVGLAVLVLLAVGAGWLLARRRSRPAEGPHDGSA